MKTEMATFSADARVTSGLVTRTHDQRNRAAPPCPCCAAANRPDCAAANRPDDCAVAANFPHTAPAHRIPHVYPRHTIPTSSPELLARARATSSSARPSLCTTRADSELACTPTLKLLLAPFFSLRAPPRSCSSNHHLS